MARCRAHEESTCLLTNAWREAHSLLAKATSQVIEATSQAVEIMRKVSLEHDALVADLVQKCKEICAVEV